MPETILLQDNDLWVEVTLNRPQKLNSFNDEMHLTLRAVLERAISGTARAILLTGSGRGFCAGQDLGDRDPSETDGPTDLGHTLETLYNPLVLLIKEAPLPVICAVNGVAAGAGANLALACDIVLAAEEAKFVQSFANVGLVPDAGGSWFLTQALGPPRAKALAMTGQPLSATQAADWGLIWKTYPADELMSSARALTEKLANGPTMGFAHTKGLIDVATTNSFEGQLALEVSAQRNCGASADYAEGVSAFLNKRKPEFTGS